MFVVYGYTLVQGAGLGAGRCEGGYESEEPFPTTCHLLMSTTRGPPRYIPPGSKQWLQLLAGYCVIFTQLGKLKLSNF